jgi:hypothetical protein
VTSVVQPSETKNLVPVHPQPTEAWQTVKSRLNRNALSGLPTARCRVACPRLCVGMSSTLRRAWQSARFETQEPCAIRGQTGSQSRPGSPGPSGVKNQDLSSTPPARRNRTPNSGHPCSSRSGYLSGPVRLDSFCPVGQIELSDWSAELSGWTIRPPLRPTARMPANKSRTRAPSPQISKSSGVNHYFT